jgi:pimeloyl-ACP methyl ester carboxylesterase
MSVTVRRPDGAPQYRPADEVRVVSAQDNGRGLLYVLLPGLGAAGEVMQPLADCLVEAGHNYLIIEAPGHGYADPAGCGMSLQMSAQGVLNSGHVTRPAIYVGQSGGGMLALELAHQDNRTMGVVLVNGLLDDISDLIHRPLRRGWRHPIKAYRLLGLLAYLTLWLPEFVLCRLECPGHWMGRSAKPLIKRPQDLSAPRLHLLVRHNRSRGAWRLLWANRHYDLPSQAGRLKQPLLVLTGLSDPLTTGIAASRFLQSCQVPVTVQEVDAGHCLQLEQPEVVATYLSRFGRRPVQHPTGWGAEM